MTIQRYALCLWLFAANALAVGTTNVTDQWGADGESGWGVSVLQQGEKVFIDLFVFGTDGKATWLVTGMDLGAPSAPGHLTWTGSLFQVQGTYYGAPWNQANVTGGAVGNATFDVASANSATLSYNVGGVNVSKHMTRNTYGADDYTGNYLGALIYDASGCGIFDGHQEVGGVVSLQQGGSGALSMSANTASGACSYNGTVVAVGHLGAASGTVSCVDGTSGTFTASEIDMNVNALSGRLVAQLGACRQDGSFGGMRQ